MAQIHPTAIVHPTVELGDDVEIGPYSVVGEGVKIGSGTHLHSHVVVEQYVHIGKVCDIWSGCVLGGIPQDRKFKGEKSYLIIGDNNVIRECSTLHRAAGLGEETRIGSNNLIMAYSHIGHNCHVGNNITMANMVGISGHSVIEDRVVIGGFVGIHQFVRIGCLAMLGGYSKVVKDVPPFMMADGRPATVLDLNVVGLRRAGVSHRTRMDIKQAYKLLYRSNINVSQALDMIEAETPSSPERDYLLDFMRKIPNGYGGRQYDRPRAR